MYRIQIELVSKELDKKLRNEYHIIYKYVIDVIDISNNSLLQRIMGIFSGIPADGFRKLIGYITFKEVLTLIYEGSLEDAYKTALKYQNNFMYMWSNHELDNIKNGRLLTM